MQESKEGRDQGWRERAKTSHGDSRVGNATGGLTTQTEDDSYIGLLEQKTTRTNIRETSLS